MGNICCYIPDEGEKENNREQLKFLLLGTGESGKTTLFKQMRINYMQDYQQNEMAEKKTVILKAFVNEFRPFMLALLQEYGTLGSEELDEVAKTSYKEAHTPAFEEVSSFIRKVWQSDNARKLWKNKAKFQVTDNIEYFCNNIDRLSKENYVPTEEDFLMSRVVSVGIQEQTFEYRNVDILVVDVGGQRCERIKWISAFDNVSAVMFVAAISEFNQNLFEDATRERFSETLTVFQRTLNFICFKKTPFILFLNKEDIFKDKIKQIIDEGKDFNQYFPGIKLGKKIKNAEIKVKEYIRNKFLVLDDSNRIYPHFVTAIDKGAFKLVFKAATTIVIRRALVKHLPV